MIRGRCFSASSSHHVTCERMSFTDQSPVTPGSVSCTSDKPVYDSLNSIHALSSFCSSCCLFIAYHYPPITPISAIIRHHKEYGHPLLAIQIGELGFV